MKDKIEAQLEQLKAEYQKGAEALTTLDSQIAEVKARRKEARHTMMRISGAIQVLSELAIDSEAKPE